MGQNSKLYYEAGQTLVSMAALTHDGDQKTFLSAKTLWSDYPGYAPTVLPNAVLSGGIIIPSVSETNDYIDVSAVYCYLNGVEKTGSNKIAADTDVAITRDGGSAYQKHSITVNSSGVIAVVAGTAHTAFSDTRGANGGPPLIPVDSIEIGQVHLSSASAGLITSDEIFQVPGTHREQITSYNILYSNVENRTIGYAGVQFVSTLPLIHTGGVPAAVYAEFYEPSFTEIQNVRNLQPPRNSGSVSSETYYGTTKGSTSTSLNAGSFEYSPSDGISDDFMGKIGNKMWFKFYEDYLKDPYEIFQGRPFDTGNYPAEGVMNWTINVVAEDVAERVIA